VIQLLLVEDNPKLRPALSQGLEATGEISVSGQSESGEEALQIALESGRPDCVLMDVQLAGVWNGIEAAVALRREFPRLPVVFYSIQDDESYYRAFRRSGILSHYAYVSKSNYLLPSMLLPLFKDALAGRSFIDPEIETKVEEVARKDDYSPLSILEPNEREVAKMLAMGLTNEQIAARLGFKDKRTISRVNGAIYTSWSLNDTTNDEKVARLRAALIFRENRFIEWDENGIAKVQDENNRWITWEG